VPISAKVKKRKEEREHKKEKTPVFPAFLGASVMPNKKRRI